MLPPTMLWRDVSSEQLGFLNEAQTMPQVRAMLGVMLGVPSARGDVWTSAEDSQIFGKEAEPLFDMILDEYVYCYAFCKEQCFSPEVTSTVISIFKAIIDFDKDGIKPESAKSSLLIENSCDVNAIKGQLTNSSHPLDAGAASDLATSFTLCKKIVMYHSVDRAPQNTVGVFSKRQACAFLVYMQDTYYRHYRLFKHNFTSYKPVMLIQVDAGCGPCDKPKIARPLCQAQDSSTTMKSIVTIIEDPDILAGNGPATEAGAQAHTNTAPTANKVQPRRPLGPKSSATKGRAGMLQRKQEEREKLKQLKNQLRDQLEEMQEKGAAIVTTTGIPSVPWQTRFAKSSSLDGDYKWSTLDEKTSLQLEEAYQAHESREISLTVNNLECGTVRQFSAKSLTLINPRSGEATVLRRDTDSVETLVRLAGRQAKKQAAAAAALAFTAWTEAERLAVWAHQLYCAVRRKRAYESAMIKMFLIFKAALRRLKEKLLLRMQARVMELIGDKADLIQVKLVEKQVKMAEQIQFKPGSADIKEESFPLLGQICIALHAIGQTCGEFNVTGFFFKVEGHTAVSKKSKDGGLSTSTARALEVCRSLTIHGVDPLTLKGAGFGCYRAPKHGDARRVEIHVMDENESDVHKKVLKACGRVKMARLALKLPMAM